MIIKLCVWLASFRKPSLPPERSGEARRSYKGSELIEVDLP